MRISVQSGDGLARRMVVELPGDEVYQEVEKRLKEVARTARINGFRPGKIPAKLVRTRYAAKIQQEVLDELITSSFHQSIAQEQLHPVGTPVIEEVLEPSAERTHFSYTAAFEVLPEVVLAPLDGYTVRRPLAEVADTDIDAMLEHFRQQRCTWTVVQRPAQLADRLQISLRIVTPGVQGREKTERLKLVLGANAMPQEIEAGLVGASADDARSIELTSDGHTALCEVKVYEVAEPVLPELDAEFIKFFGIANGDIEALRNDIRSNMLFKLAEQTNNNVKWQVMNLLLDAHPIQLPSALVDRERSILVEDARQESRVELPPQWIEKQAKRRVALRLIIGEIVRQHAIVVDMARVQHTIQEIASSYEDPNEVLRHYGTAETRKVIENMVLEDQAVDFVLTQVKVETVPSSFQEVMATEGLGSSHK